MPTQALRILFIGNSHTYLHKMPWVLCELAAAGNDACSVGVDQCTGNGVSLEWHWQQRATREKMAEGGWDYVVLQERSGGTMENPDSFYRHVRLFETEIGRRGARTVLYMTWAHRDRPEDQAVIARAYRRAAANCNALLAPVGIAWQMALADCRCGSLYHADGRHAGPGGAYLTACVFFSLCVGINPTGLPGSIRVKGKRRVKLNNQQARCLQQIAFRSIEPRV